MGVPTVGQRARPSPVRDPCAIPDILVTTILRCLLPWCLSVPALAMLACAQPREFVVLDRSMEDALRPMERVIVLPPSELQRGDVVAFEYPFAYPGRPVRVLFARLIGLPGEWVEVRQGTVVVNGQPLSEPYVKNRTAQDTAPQLVPPGYYFVLSDDRSSTRDSRVWGMLPASKVVGVVQVPGR